MKETTGKRLRAIMSDRGLKQVDILKMCEPYCQKYDKKLAKNDLSQYINDKVQPKQDKLSILGMALGVSEAWLMGYDVPMEPAASSGSAPAAMPSPASLSLSAVEEEIILKFRAADEFDQETVLRTLRIKREGSYHSLGGVG